MTADPNARELLDFFRIDPRDLESLSSLRERFERDADQFVGAFYRHLLQYPETQKLLRDPETRDRLLGKQREYLLSLTDRKIDDAYVANRAQIGTAHERVGLETRWYLGAYALYFNLLLPSIQDSLKHDPVAQERAVSALAKRLFLDAELAIGQYIDRREDELQRLNRELRVEGRALTKEVDETTRDLHRTRARAHAAEQLVSVATLVTGLAHEVGTPMGVIRGHAEALEGSVEGERAQWRLQIILEQIDRITRIIQSLLNIARPKQSLRVPLELAELVDTSIAFLSEKIRRRSVQVVKDLAPVPPVIGDPEKMQQVFLNLFLNAIDAMPEGGELRIAIASVDASEVEIRIKDSGNGIPQDQLAAIFDPFYTTKAAGHGNGLGLVVVEGIVDEFGGHIEAHSEPGAGTQFVIRLPVASATEEMSD